MIEAGGGSFPARAASSLVVSGLGLAKHLAEVWISHRVEDLVDVGAQVTLLQQSSSQL